MHRSPNGDMQQAPTAKIGLLANASLRVEPYATPPTPSFRISKPASSNQSPFK